MHLVAIVLALLQGNSPSVGPAMARIRAEVLAAIDGDSVALVERRWSRSSRDPVILVGLASLAANTYRYDQADRLYRSLLARGPTVDPAIRAWATLGLGLSAHARGQIARADSLYREAAAIARTNGDTKGEIDALVAWSG